MQKTEIQDFVTDEASVIKKRELTIFNKTLEALKKRDGEDVRFVFVSNNESYDQDEDFFAKNNIGDTQRHNGIIFLLNTKDNQIQILVGKGLYMKYTDTFQHQYAENIIKPNLRNKQYKKIIETWIYDHDGGQILEDFREVEHTKWEPVVIILQLIFVPFLTYALFDILKQIGYIPSLFAVGFISHLAYIFYREGGFGFLWNQRKSGPWSIFAMMLLVIFIFALFSFYGWILSGMLAFAYIYLGKKYKKRHWLGLGAIFFLYTNIVFFPSTCDQNKCVTYLGGFQFHHTASEKRGQYDS